MPELLDHLVDGGGGRSGVVGDEEVAAGGTSQAGEQRPALGFEGNLVGLARAGRHHEHVDRNVYGAGDGRHLFRRVGAGRVGAVGEHDERAAVGSAPGHDGGGAGDGVVERRRSPGVHHAHAIVDGLDVVGELVDREQPGVERVEGRIVTRRVQAPQNGGRDTLRQVARRADLHAARPVHEQRHAGRGPGLGAQVEDGTRRAGVEDLEILAAKARHDFAAPVAHDGGHRHEIDARAEDRGRRLLGPSRTSQRHEQTRRGEPSKRRGHTCSRQPGKLSERGVHPLSSNRSPNARGKSLG